MWFLPEDNPQLFETCCSLNVLNMKLYSYNEISVHFVIYNKPTRCNSWEYCV